MEHDLCDICGGSSRMRWKRMKVARRAEESKERKTRSSSFHKVLLEAIAGPRSVKERFDTWARWSRRLRQKQWTSVVRGESQRYTAGDARKWEMPKLVWFIAHGLIKISLYHGLPHLPPANYQFRWVKVANCVYFKRPVPCLALRTLDDSN